MKTRLLSVLLLSAALPFAAAAQDTSTSPDGMNSTTGNGGATMNDTAPSSDTGASSTSPDSTTPTVDSGTSMDSGSATTPSSDISASMATEAPFVTVPETGAWRVSDLEGKAVYGSDGANIGEINDVLVSQDGSVNAVIIGVGGFLGIGEKDVAVNMSALQLGPGDTQAQADAAASALPDPTGPTGAVGSTEPDAAATSGQTAMGMDGSVGTTGEAPGAMADAKPSATIGDDALPDRIILNVTREELEKAPAFEGVKAQP